MNILILLMVILSCSNKNLKLENKMFKCFKTQLKTDEEIYHKLIRKIHSRTRTEEGIVELISGGFDVNYAN